MLSVVFHNPQEPLLHFQVIKAMVNKPRKQRACKVWQTFDNHERQGLEQ
jgi:hypothetical protein